jgi:hypothetical protein
MYYMLYVCDDRSYESSLLSFVRGVAFFLLYCLHMSHTEYRVYCQYLVLYF